MSRTKPNEYDLFRTFRDECSVDDFRQIVKTAVQQARDGSHEARLWLSAYVLGRPHENALRLSSLDSSEAMQAESNELMASIFPPKRRTGRK